MFRILFRQLHTIKIAESNLFFPVSRISLETKDDQLWDHEIFGKKEKYYIADLAHSKASCAEHNQIV